MPKADPIRITIRITIRTPIRAMWIRAGIRAMGILAISAMWIRARARAMGIHTALQPTWGHLRRALTATTTIIPMPAYPMATMDQAGSRTESLLASGRGAEAIVASTGAVAFPAAEDSAGESVVVTPVEVDVGSAEAVVPMVDVGSVGATVASAEAAVPMVEVAVGSAGATVASVEAVMVEAEVEAVPMVVGAGRFHH